MRVLENSKISECNTIGMNLEGVDIFLFKALNVNLSHLNSMKASASF
jgi:hypothetical protein